MMNRYDKVNAFGQKLRADAEPLPGDGMTRTDDEGNETEVEAEFDPDQVILMVQYALDDRYQERDRQLDLIMGLEVFNDRVSAEGSGAGFGMRDHEYWLHGNWADGEAEDLLVKIHEMLGLTPEAEDCDDYAFLT